MTEEINKKKRFIRGEFIVEGHSEDKEYLNILTQATNRLELKGYIKKIENNKYLIVVEGCKTNIEIFAQQVIKNTVPGSLNLVDVKATNVIFKPYKGNLPTFKIL